MFVKVIITLIIMIAVTALGASYLGDGFFEFQEKAKAAKLTEFTRDLSNIMQTYKAAQNANISVFNAVDLPLAGVTTAGVAGDNEVDYDEMIGELNNDLNLVKGTGQVDLGDMTVITDATNVAVFLTNQSLDITDGICKQINRVFDNADVIEADITTLGVDQQAMLTAAGVSTDGTIEGGCLEDSVLGVKGNAANVFFYYVQER
jgi:hypothetical protein